MGKQFPAIGRTVAEYMTVGDELLGNTIQQDEKVITVDDLLVAHTFIARIDEAMSQFEVRSEYSRQMGDALAQTYDRNLFSLAIKAARDTGAGGLGVGAVGQQNAQSVAVGTSPTVDTIIEAAFTAATAFDNAFIPDDNRFLFVSPANYYALVQSDKLLNLWYNPGNNGSFSNGDVKSVAGFQIVKTTNMALNHTASSAYPDFTGYTGEVPALTAGKYGVDASATVGLFYHPQALGTVVLLDMASEMEYQIRRQGTLMVSKLAVGHGVLRPECIYEIKATAS